MNNGASAPGGGLHPGQSQVRFGRPKQNLSHEDVVVVGFLFLVAVVAVLLLLLVLLMLFFYPPADGYD